MAQYKSRIDILQSQSNVICFASSAALKPSDIHGGKDVLPMEKISPLAARLAQIDKRIPLRLAGMTLRAMEGYKATGVLMLPGVKIDDRLLIAFFVRRHHEDSISDNVVAGSAIALFRLIVQRLERNDILSVALERPEDATKKTDTILSFLPDTVTIYD